MTNYNTKFEPIKLQWNQVVISSEELVEQEEFSTENIVALARAKKVITYLDSLFNAIDPDFLTSNTIDSLENLIKSVNKNLIDCKNNINYLSSLNLSLDNILNLSEKFIPVLTKKTKILIKSMIPIIK